MKKSELRKIIRSVIKEQSQDNLLKRVQRLINLYGTEEKLKRVYNTFKNNGEMLAWYKTNFEPLRSQIPSIPSSDELIQLMKQEDTKVIREFALAMLKWGIALKIMMYAVETLYNWLSGHEKLPTSSDDPEPTTSQLNELNQEQFIAKYGDIIKNASIEDKNYVRNQYPKLKRILGDGKDQNKIVNFLETNFNSEEEIQNWYNQNILPFENILKKYNIPLDINENIGLLQKAGRFARRLGYILIVVSYFFLYCC